MATMNSKHTQTTLLINRLSVATPSPWKSLP